MKLINSFLHARWDVNNFEWTSLAGGVKSRLFSRRKLNSGNPMKTSRKSTSRAAFRALGGMDCAGAVMLIAFAAPAQTYTMLDAPSGVNGTIAYGVFGNNIVGNYYNSALKVYGFLYNGSTYTTLDDPLGANGTYAYGINGNTVVGFYQDSASIPHGFLYNGSTYTTFNNPLGVNGTYLRGISGNNLVGWYSDNTHLSYSFFYNGNTFTKLYDPLGIGNGTVAYGIDG